MALKFLVKAEQIVGCCAQKEWKEETDLVCNKLAPDVNRFGTARPEFGNSDQFHFRTRGPWATGLIHIHTVLSPSISHVCSSSSSFACLMAASNSSCTPFPAAITPKFSPRSLPSPKSRSSPRESVIVPPASVTRREPGAWSYKYARV